MSEKTDIEPTENLAEKRRRYLANKARASMHAMLGWIVAIISGLITAVFTGLSIAMIMGRHPSMMPFLIATAVFGWSAIAGAKIVTTANDNLVRLAHVPPVGKQIADLPEANVLVRGTEHPDIADSELLHPADASTETRWEQLLRPHEAK